MSVVTYSKAGLYYSTPQTSWYLSNYVDRGLSRDSTDSVYTITSRYNLRPDLLSYDLYGTVDYKWTFVFLNPDVIKDPIYDFTLGKAIFTATLDRLRNLLGG